MKICFDNVRVPFYTYAAPEVNTESSRVRHFLQESDWPRFTLCNIKVISSDQFRHLTINLRQLPESEVQKMCEAVSAICKYFASALKIPYKDVPIDAIDIPVSRRCNWSCADPTTADVLLTVRGVHISSKSFDPILSIDNVATSDNAQVEYSPGTPSSDAPSYHPGSPSHLTNLLVDVDWHTIAEAVTTAKEGVQPPAPPAKPLHEPTSPGARYYWGQLEKSNEQVVIQYYRCKQHTQFICPNCEVHVPTWETFKSQHAGCHSFQSRNKLTLCKICAL